MAAKGGSWKGGKFEPAKGAEHREEGTHAPSGGSSQHSSAPSPPASTMPAPEPARNPYEEKKARRIERLRARAAKADAEAEGRIATAHRTLDMIPMGQPILVGHHSERRHRRDLEKAHGNLRKGFEAKDRAEELKRRASRAEKNDAISSDDPHAVPKLQAKLQRLEEMVGRAKDINKAVRSKNPREALQKLGLKEATIESALKPDFAGRKGVPGYVLSNARNEMARIRERISGLEKRDASPARAPLKIKDAEVHWNGEANRVQIRFPGKPDAAQRSALKSRGFRWAPSEGAWQRQASERAWYDARAALGDG